MSQLSCLTPRSPGFSHTHTHTHTKDRAEATLTAELAGSSCRAASSSLPLRQSRHWALQNANACPITAASAATPPPSWLQISFSLKRLVSLQHCDPVQKIYPSPPSPPPPFAALPSTSSPAVTSMICPNSCLLETFPGSINPSLRCARSHASNCRPFLGVSLPQTGTLLRGVKYLSMPAIPDFRAEPIAAGRNATYPLLCCILGAIDNDI